MLSSTWCNTRDVIIVLLILIVNGVRFTRVTKCCIIIQQSGIWYVYCMYSIDGQNGTL